MIRTNDLREVIDESKVRTDIVELFRYDVNVNRSGAARLAGDLVRAIRRIHPEKDKPLLSFANKLNTESEPFSVARLILGEHVYGVCVYVTMTAARHDTYNAYKRAHEELRAMGWILRHLDDKDVDKMMWTLANYMELCMYDLQTRYQLRKHLGLEKPVVKPQQSSTFGVCSSCNAGEMVYDPHKDEMFCGVCGVIDNSCLADDPHNCHHHYIWVGKGMGWRCINCHLCTHLRDVELTTVDLEPVPCQHHWFPARYGDGREKGYYTCVRCLVDSEYQVQSMSQETVDECDHVWGDMAVPSNHICRKCNSIGAFTHFKTSSAFRNMGKLATHVVGTQYPLAVVNREIAV